MKSKFIYGYAFIIGLACLIINDHYLKAEFGNWFTGKLSDFAGIFIFPLFLVALFRCSKISSIAITIAGFVFWKSEFSQGLINLMNEWSPIYINRVVDYSDFLAFSVLPLSYVVMKNAESESLATVSYHKLKLNITLFIAFLAFSATTTDDEGVYPEILSPRTTLNCCAVEPIYDTLGNGIVYIPTVFTPDEDGLNDYFQISTDSNILKIDTFLVTLASNNDTVFFKVDMFDLSPKNGFDGNYFGGTIPREYRYSVWVTSSDFLRRKYVGGVCGVPCDKKVGFRDSFDPEECRFASQFDAEKGFDPKRSSGQSIECFSR